MSRILVTGGAGFLGSALVKRLVWEGSQVVVLDDFSRGRRERLADAFRVDARGSLETVEGDVRNPETVAGAMQGCDSVIHMAYCQGTQTFYAEPRQVLDVAIRGMLNVLAACERTGCSELLLVSSSEAYQVASVVPTPETIPLTVPDVLNPRYSYGGGKIACELMALAWARTGVLDRLIIARPHNIYGPDMGREHVIPEFCLRMNRLIEEYPAGEIPFPIQGTGEETRSFCYIDDCVEQFKLMLDHASNLDVYHVGTRDEKTIREVADAVARCYGRSVKVVPGVLPKGSPPRRLPDTSKIEKIGGQQRVGFAEGLQDTVEWYRANR